MASQDSQPHLALILISPTAPSNGAPSASTAPDDLQHLLSHPLLHTATRYKATSTSPSSTPSYLLLLPSTPHTFPSLHSLPIPPTLTFQPRLYTPLTTFPPPSSSHSTPSHPAPTLLLVSMQPTPTLPLAEFTAWYETEHTPLFARVPGWVRTARYELAEGPAGVARFLALHEWEGEEAFETEEFRHATSTPWRNEIVSKVEAGSRERWVFGLDGTGQ